MLTRVIKYYSTIITLYLRYEYARAFDQIVIDKLNKYKKICSLYCSMKSRRCIKDNGDYAQDGESADVVSDCMSDESRYLKSNVRL